MTPFHMDLGFRIPIRQFQKIILPEQSQNLVKIVSLFPYYSNFENNSNQQFKNCLNPLICELHE